MSRSTPGSVAGSVACPTSFPAVSKGEARACTCALGHAHQHEQCSLQVQTGSFTNTWGVMAHQTRVPAVDHANQAHCAPLPASQPASHPSTPHHPSTTLHRPPPPPTQAPHTAEVDTSMACGAQTAPLPLLACLLLAACWAAGARKLSRCEWVFSEFSDDGDTSVCLPSPEVAPLYLKSYQTAAGNGNLAAR